MWKHVVGVEVLGHVQGAIITSNQVVLGLASDKLITMTAKCHNIYYALLCTAVKRQEPIEITSYWS